MGGAAPPVPGAPAPRAILFDWDNTLVDNWASIHGALNAALAAMDAPPWTMEETLRRVRRSLRDSFPEMFGARWMEARRVFYQRLEATHLDTLRSLPGAESLLAELARRRIYLGVVSNKTGHYLRREAAHLGWDGYFGRLVGAADAGADKPAPEPVRLALKGSGVAPGAEVWLVGDAAVDLECARNAGCVAVLIERPGSEEEVRGLSPDHRFAALADLQALVRRWEIPHI